MNLTKKLDEILMRVEKPARYIGGEVNSVIKNEKETMMRFGFAFPDTYEIGMSYLGLQIIYHLLNHTEGVACERLFAPASDMELIMREENLPLFTLETKAPAAEMDIVGFTLQYELSFTNVINMLDLSGIPLKSSDRGEEWPFIAAGGPCAFNPEPLADLIDFFLLGDGEEILPEICRAYMDWKASGAEKTAFLETIVRIPGVYVPRFYQPRYGENGELTGFDKLFEGAPDKVTKRLVTDLDKSSFPDANIVPFIDIIHDRATVEIFRGCTRGCRFCQAGMLYRPVRERSKGRIQEIAEKQLSGTGYEEMSILSLSTGDYSEIEPLVTDLMDMCRDRNVSLSLPSLRLDSFSFQVMEDIQGYKKSGLTFAPEAGTQRLRDVINKNITEEDIFSAAEQAIELGWQNIKLYFMVGLPTETDADLDGIVDIARRIGDINYKITGKRGGRFNITISVSNFVPKAHTPFQWSPQVTQEEFNAKHNYLRDRLRPLKGVTFNYHGARTSYLEAVFAKGDRRVTAALIKAWELGCKFDGWREHFKYYTWMEAFQQTGIDPNFYTKRALSYKDVLPWDLMDCGVTKEFLARENECAIGENCTQDCREGCNQCGIHQVFGCNMLHEYKAGKKVAE